MLSAQIGELLVRMIRQWYVIAAVAILAVATILKLQAGTMPSPPVINWPAMPPQNARDYTIAAAALERDQSNVDWAIGKPMPMPAGMDPAVAANPSSGYHVFTLAEKERLAGENEPAIAKLREGFQYPYVYPPTRSFRTLFPDLAKDRGLARLLTLDSQVRSAQGDYGGAMRDCVDSIELGADLPNDSCIIGMLVGVACEAIGRRAGASEIDYLTSAQAKSAARRLSAIEARQVPAWESVEFEEHATQASLMDMFHDSNWRRDFLAAAGIIGSDSSSSGPTRAEQLELEVESPKTAFDNYTAYMDRAIAQDKLSWPKQRSAPPIPIPTDYVNQMLLPVFAQARFKQYGTFAENRLFETQLALRAYLLDHGRYPATLDELIPGYLPSLPIDPFTDGAPLKYRTTSSGYLLYSVGPDTIDNGGTPIFDGTMSDGTPNYSALTTADEKGDIVAGISR